MARLPEEQWAMIEDSIEKKRTAASAFKQRTHCGKGGRVKFPSDNLSKKELKAMSGECKSYRLNAPMSWDEYKSMPDDLKVGYIQSIRDRFGAPDKYVADMFGCSQGQLGLYLRDLKLEVNAKVETWEKESFLAWMTGADTTLVKENEPEAEVVEAVKYDRKPITYVEFKSLSDDKKREYITWIRETFGATDKAIAEMLGVNKTTFACVVRKLQCGVGSASGGAKRNWNRAEFDTWARGEAPVKIEEKPIIEEPEVDILEEPEITTTSTDIEPIDIPYEDLYENPVLEPFAERPRDIPITELPYPERIDVHPTPITAIPTFGELNFDCPADQALNTLAILLGNKHVQLNVRWDVVF